MIRMLNKFVLISLTIINLAAQRGTEHRILAIQFAREGIEVFRNLRDTKDWLDVDEVLINDFTDHYFNVDFLHFRRIKIIALIILIQHIENRDM